VVVEDGDSAPLPPRPAAPSASPSPTADRCPPPGVRFEADPEGEAAMGLRILGFQMINCGRDAYRVKGYPVMRALDEKRRPLDVQVLLGVDKITTGAPNAIGPPQQVVLQPGERATTVVAWRNTYDDVRQPPVEVAYLEIAPAAGEPAQLVAASDPLNLGSTGRLGISPWLAPR
jgi:hypothetical protein